MLRILGTVIGIFSTATLLTLLMVVLYSWTEGNLNSDSSKEIVAILKGDPRPLPEEMSMQEQEMVSYDEITEKRTEKFLNISTRETELGVLKKSIEDQLASVESKITKLEQLKKTIKDELDKENEKIHAESVEQARGILLKMEVESAVEKLLSLDVTDSVLLLKGMNEKDAARILDQFRLQIAGNDPLIRIKKAEEIYKAIYHGKPLIDTIQNARNELNN